MFTKRELDAMGWFVFEFAAFTNDFFVVSNVSNFWRCDFFFCCCSFGSNIERYRRCLHWHSSLKHTDITELLACFQTLCSGWYQHQLDKYQKTPQVTFREVSGEWKHPFNYLLIPWHISHGMCLIQRTNFLKIRGFFPALPICLLKAVASLQSPLAFISKAPTALVESVRYF